jgi:hypothetical protein
MIWDERDKMREKNLPLAMTRMDASKWKWVTMLSTPTYPNFGVDKEFRGSDKRYWFIKCPMCGEQQTPDWDANVKIGNSHRDTIFECIKCHKEIPHDRLIEASDATGNWQITDSQFSDESHGYQINQLFSPTRKVSELAKIFFKGQENPDALRELYNSALGLPYISEGTRLTVDILDGCCENGPPDLIDPRTPEGMFPGQRVSIGVDVGKVLHVTASTTDLSTGKRKKVVAQTMSWEELHDWLTHVEDFVLVIDRHPETTKARELALRFWGRVFMCTYKPQAEPADWHYPVDRSEVGEVKADRTLCFDYIYSMYARRQVELPVNMRHKGEHQQNLPYNGWYRQMMSQMRVEQLNRAGNMIATYEEVDGADHWHHAELYDMLASWFLTPNLPPLKEQQGQILTLEDFGIETEQMFDVGFTLDDFDPDMLG